MVTLDLIIRSSTQVFHVQPIPSLATTVHFSALAFLGAHKFPKQPDSIFRTIYLLSNPSENTNL